MPSRVSAMMLTEFPVWAQIYFGVLAFIFGACMGSFLNCAAYRVVRGESFIKGRSKCPSCGHELGIRDLFPVISWIALKGKCRYCGSRVSARYILTETLFGLLTVICLIAFGPTLLCARNYIFICVLFVLTLTDIDDMTIPDGCHVAAVITWAVFEPFLASGWADAVSHIAAGLLFGGGLLAVSLAMDKAMGRDTLGGGDIKLIAVCGLYLGFIGTLSALMIACIAGLIFNSIANKSSEKGKAFPFGPWIALGTAVMMLAGGPLIEWYGSLLI